MIAGILALVLTLAACSDSDFETSVAEFSVSIDDETTWQEAFDAFSADEQVCIRSEIDAESLELVLAAPIADEDWGRAQEVKSIFSCLSTETARSLYVSIGLATFLADDVTAEGEPSEDKQAVEAPTPTPTPSPTPTPPPLPTEVPPPPPTVSEEPSAASADASDDHGDSIEEATSVMISEAFSGEVDYGGDVDFFMFEFEADQQYQIDVELVTLEDSVATLYDRDGAVLITNDDDHRGSLASRIDWLADYSGTHYVKVSSWDSEGTGAYVLSAVVATTDVDASSAVDDHGDSFEEATAAVAGEAIEGAMNFANDVDVFAFELDAGQLYKFDVELGTLHDSVATLYDRDGVVLRSNDDHGDSLASQVSWRTEYSGMYYVGVTAYSGQETGSYTLTASTAVDDHGNSVDQATTAVVGEAVEGTVDHGDDVDAFAFEFEAGQLYQIDVERDTLSASVAALYDSDGVGIVTNDSFGSSPTSRIYWEAESSGTHYVVVSGADQSEGSYTLTVIVR